MRRWRRYVAAVDGYDEITSRLYSGQRLTKQDKRRMVVLERMFREYELANVNLDMTGEFVRWEERWDDKDM